MRTLLTTVVDCLLRFFLRSAPSRSAFPSLTPGVKSHSPIKPSQPAVSRCGAFVDDVGRAGRGRDRTDEIGA